MLHSSVEVTPVLRGAIRRFRDETGRLWTTLADYHTRLGQFERARDTFEEGMEAVITVRDFSVIFEAYVPENV